MHFHQGGHVIPIVHEVRHRFFPFELYINHVVDDGGDLYVEDGTDVVLAVSQDLGYLPSVSILRHTNEVGAPLFVILPV